MTDSEIKLKIIRLIDQEKGETLAAIYKALLDKLQILKPGDRESSAHIVEDSGVNSGQMENIWNSNKQPDWDVIEKGVPGITMEQLTTRLENLRQDRSLPGRM